MRAGWLLVVLAAAAAVACRPDIGFGTYACGPNASCPTDQKCDEAMDLCVDPPTATGFTCFGSTPEPDDSTATAASLGQLTCISAPVVLASCLGSGGDVLDLVTFSTAATCSQVAVNATLSYQEAYEELTLTLAGSDGTTVIATDTACAVGTAEDGALGRCVTAPLTPGSAYFLRVATTGSGDCDGRCAFNRYSLSVQITQ